MKSDGVSGGGLTTQDLTQGASFWEALIEGRRSYSRPMPNAARAAPTTISLLPMLQKFLCSWAAGPVH